ncbi:MAG: ATP-binding protein [Chloroflexota bacterium]|nr:ATP-binding protein [Chloroflexota bacterium]
MAVREQRQFLATATEPTLAWLRLFVVALTGIALVAGGFAQAGSRVAWGVVLVAGMYAAANSMMGLYRRFRRLLTRRVYLVMDLALITLLVHATDGVGSPLFLLYSLPLVVVVLHHGVRAGACYCAAVSVLYTIVVQLGTEAETPVWLSQLGLLWALFLMTGYVSTADESREERARRRDELAAMQLAAAAATHTGDIPTVVENVLTGALGPTRCCYASIFLYDEETHGFTTCYSLSGCDGRGGSLEQQPVEVLPSDLLYQVMYTGNPISISDTHADRRLRGSVLDREGIRSMVLTPLIAPGAKRVGILCLARNEAHRATQHEMRFAGTLSMQAAVGIHTACLFEEAASLEAAKEADRLRSQLLATVSHELRTPIAAIQGFASSLKCAEDLGGLPPEMQRDWIEEIESNADRLKRLVTDLLDLSRLEAGALHMNLDLQDIHDVIDELRPNLEVLAGTHPLVIKVQSTLPLLVRCDAERIGQVLSNLVENAAKFSPPESTLVIGAERHEGVIRIGVRDEGQGIPPEDQEKVFERFYQVEGGGHRPTGGTGLGLAICRSIIEAHGGRIWVESQVGQGSIFYIILPPPTSGR